MGSNTSRPRSQYLAFLVPRNQYALDDENSRLESDPWPCYFCRSIGDLNHRILQLRDRITRAERGDSRVRFDIVAWDYIGTGNPDRHNELRFRSNAIFAVNCAANCCHGFNATARLGHGRGEVPQKSPPLDLLVIKLDADTVKEFARPEAYAGFHGITLDYLTPEDIDAETTGQVRFALRRGPIAQNWVWATEVPRERQVLDSTGTTDNLPIANVSNIAQVVRLEADLPPPYDGHEAQVRPTDEPHRRPPYSKLPPRPRAPMGRNLNNQDLRLVDVRDTSRARDAGHEARVRSQLETYLELPISGLPLANLQYGLTEAALSCEALMSLVTYPVLALDSQAGPTDGGNVEDGDEEDLIRL